MICPHCLKQVDIPNVAFWNVERYGEPAITITNCCGKGVSLHRRISFEAVLPYRHPEYDDWGNKLNQEEIIDPIKEIHTEGDVEGT